MGRKRNGMEEGMKGGGWDGRWLGKDSDYKEKEGEGRGTEWKRK